MATSEGHQYDDQRECHALRAHIDALVASGASIDGRDPLRLNYGGVAHWVACGMLISEYPVAGDPERGQS